MREAGRHLQQTYQVSEQRAGQVLSLGNSSLRYCSGRPATEELRRRLRELEAERPRYGYQQLWALQRREGWAINHKRVYRIYREEEGLKLRKRLAWNRLRWRAIISLNLAHGEVCQRGKSMTKSGCGYKRPVQNPGGA